MKNNVTLLIGAAFAWCAFATLAAEKPKAWFPAGSHPGEYEMSLDRETVHGGKASACLKSIVPKTSGFGTLMQTCRADPFRGQRVRLTGFLRAKDVLDWAGLWMRVDGARGELLAFDNMQNRPVKGTCAWTRHAIVLDVPDTAEEIAFGLLLTGRGQVWMDDLKFEVVGKDVPTTAPNAVKQKPAGPANLDFEL